MVGISINLSWWIILGFFAFCILQSLLICIIDQGVFFVAGLNLSIAMGILFLIKPIWAAFFLLLTNWFPFALLTEGDKPFLPSFGGVNIEGIRLVFADLFMMIYFFFKYHKIRPLCIGFYFYGIFLLLVSISLLKSPDAMNGLRYLLKAVFPILLFFLIVTETQDQKYKEGIAKIISFVAWISIIINLLSPIGGIPIFIERQGVTSFAGLSGYIWFPYQAGVISLFFYSRWRGNGGNANLALFVALAIGVILTATRIAVLGILLGIVFIECIRSWKKGVLAGLGVIMVGMFIFLFFPPLRERMFPAGRNADFNVILDNIKEGNVDNIFTIFRGSGREDVWPYILENVFWTNPWLGQGAGASDFYLLLSPDPSMRVAGHVHSEYLRILSEMGIIGLILFILAYLFIFARIANEYRYSKDGFQQRSHLAAMAVLIFLLIIGITDNAFNYYGPLTSYAWTIVAIAWRPLTREFKKDEMRRKGDP